MATQKNRIGPVIDEGIPGANSTINQFDLDALFPAEKNLLPDEKPPIENTALPDPAVLQKAATASATAPSREISITAARPGEAEPWVLGRCQAKGKIIAADDTETFLVLDHLWSVGECEELEGMYFDGVFEGLATQLGNNEHWTGEASQTASAILTALKGSYDTLDGKAHSVLSYHPTFSMNVKMGMKGIKFYDPRQSPQGYYYSANPALALAHVLASVGYVPNWDSVANAANYCDEIIGATSPQTKRWEIGGQILDRGDAKTWIKTLATYANCFVDRIGSEVYLIPDEPRSPNHTITADDMIAGTVRVSRTSTRNVPEVVTVYGQTFEGEPIEYSYPPAVDPASGARTDLQMPFFQTIHACGRKAEEVYNNAQDDLTLEFVGFDKGLQRTIGDVGTITNAAFGLSSVPMTLIEHEQVGRGRWRSKYSKYTAYHSDTIYTATYASTSLDNPYFPPAGPTPTAYEFTYTDGAGNEYQRFRIQFTGQTWAYLKDYYVTVETGGEEVFQRYVTHKPKSGSPLTEQTHTVYTDFPLVAGESYNVKVYVRSNVLALSEEPGETNITALDLFDNYFEEDRGGAYEAWINPENSIVDNGADFASVNWDYDEESESHYLQIYESGASAAVPDTATITNVRFDIRAWKLNNDSVVNIKGVQMFNYFSDPGGNVQTSQAVTTTPTIYTFEGDPTYWGLTSSEIMQLFDGSNDGWIQIIGECVDTLALGGGSPAMTLYVDWAKCSVTYTE